MSSIEKSISFLVYIKYILCISNDTVLKYTSEANVCCIQEIWENKISLRYCRKLISLILIKGIKVYIKVKGHILIIFYLIYVNSITSLNSHYIS